MIKRLSPHSGYRRLWQGQRKSRSSEIGLSGTGRNYEKNLQMLLDRIIIPLNPALTTALTTSLCLLHFAPLPVSLPCPVSTCLSLHCLHLSLPCCACSAFPTLFCPAACFPALPYLTLSKPQPFLAYLACFPALSTHPV